MAHKFEASVSVAESGLITRARGLQRRRIPKNAHYLHACGCVSRLS